MNPLSLSIFHSLLHYSLHHISPHLYISFHFLYSFTRCAHLFLVHLSCCPPYENIHTLDLLFLRPYLRNNNIVHCLFPFCNIVLTLSRSKRKIKRLCAFFLGLFWTADGLFNSWNFRPHLQNWLFRFQIYKILMQN